MKEERVRLGSLGWTRLSGDSGPGSGLQCGMLCVLVVEEVRVDWEEVLRRVGGMVVVVVRGAGLM